MKASAVILLLATIALSGCYAIPLEPQYQAYKTVKLTAIGYGSASSYERYTEGQKRLMAMRASKLDAYRAMAEQVYGVRVTGSSTVGAMMVQNDNFRVSIDAYVRGARVSNITQMADGNYETTIEMDFDDSIVRSFVAQVPVRAVASPVYSPAYVTVPAYNPAYVTVPVYNPYTGRGAVGPGTSYGASYYYAD